MEVYTGQERRCPTDEKMFTKLADQQDFPPPRKVAEKIDNVERSRQVNEIFQSQLALDWISCICLDLSTSPPPNSALSPFFAFRKVRRSHKKKGKDSQPLEVFRTKVSKQINNNKPT